MSITFKENGHLYESNDGEDIKWTSVTSLISHFKPKFDAPAQAKRSSKNRKSKWYGMHEKDILKIWNNETQRAVKLGNWYHDQRESDMLDFETIERDGVGLPIIKPLSKDGVKIASNQKLENGVYPEHMVYLKSARLCGQADVVEIVNGKINITDYKTNKEIKEKGYTNWEGITCKMFNPLGNLDDCNLTHYSIQLSIYAYIIQKHNPKLKVGKLIIQHVKFKQLGVDENGYPINELVKGEPVIDKVKIYKLPYLKDEVVSLIMWLKDNKI